MAPILVFLGRLLEAFRALSGPPSLDVTCLYSSKRLTDIDLLFSRPIIPSFEVTAVTEIWIELVRFTQYTPQSGIINSFVNMT